MPIIEDDDHLNFSPIQTADSLDILRKSVNGLLLDDVESSPASTIQGLTQFEIKSYIDQRVQEEYEWFVNFDLTGTVTGVAETGSRYEDNDDGHIVLDLTNLTNEFCVNGSADTNPTTHRVKFVVDGYATIISDPLPLGTLTLPVSPAFDVPNLSGKKTYNIEIYDHRADYTSNNSPGIDSPKNDYERNHKFSLYLPYNTANNIVNLSTL